MGTIRGFIPHVQVGYGSLHDFFSRPLTKASAHFWCRADGYLEQYVDTDDKAWAEGNGNPYFISCEFEGQVDEPMTDAQLDTGGRLIAWAHSNIAMFPLVVNEDPNGSGVTPHRAGGAAWGGHSCPGDLRFSQYPALVDSANRWLGAPNPAPRPEDDLTPDEHYALMNVQETVGRLETYAYAEAHAAGGANTTDAGLVELIKGLPAATVAAIKAAL